MAESIDLTPAEIRKQGWDALVSQLGVAKSLRILLEYEKGLGNYTELRKKLFAGRTVNDILDDMANEEIIRKTSDTSEVQPGKRQMDSALEGDSSV